MVSLADGDDLHDQTGNVVANRSDEDGLTVSVICISRDAYTLHVRVYNNSGQNATVSAWIDFNRNGVFDASERAQTVVPTTPNLIHYNGTDAALIWKDLSGLTEGWTYARLRVASTAAEVASPTGVARSGAVEDYTLMIEPPQYDYGDAPDSYGTRLSSNGPRHIYSDVSTNLCLSNGLIANNIDAETDGQPSTQADGDNALPTDFFSSFFTFNDETGLVQAPVLTSGSTSCSATLSVRNNTGTVATLSGWIDFNRNGVFDANERAQATVPSASTGSLVQVVLYWSTLNNLTAGQTFGRFRLASNAADVANPTGMASDGEVEDYSLMIAQAPLPVALVSFQGQWVEPKGNQLSWVTSWETNNDYFEIQRSPDAQRFESIGRVAGKGTTSAMQSYEFMDEPGGLTDVLYYRLKQVDLDGSLSYSRIVAIRHALSAELSLTVYPNPASDQLSLRLTHGAPVGQIGVYSVAGRQVLHQAGASESVDIRALPAGVYVVEVRTIAGGVLRQRFVKQ